ncbi:MAG: hypothetical protein P9L99_19780 [Candidatus Lernaella stagnicola]|nr:hypothetical protein [Candidatus Lernaella stagnicola]
MTTSVDYTGVTVNYQLLIRMTALLGPYKDTYRLCVGRTAHVSGGSYAGTYHGLATGEARLDEGVGTKPFPELRLPEFTFAYAREDQDRYTGDMTDWLHNCKDSDTTVYVYVYEVIAGANPDDDDLVFLGFIANGGVTIQGDQVGIRADTLLSHYDFELPRLTFEDVYEYDDGGIYVGRLDQSIWSDYIPILYGDWTDQASEFAIPGFVIDHRPNQNLVARICYPNDEGVGSGIASITGLCRWTCSGGDSKEASVADVENVNYSITDASLTAGSFTAFNSYRDNESTFTQGDRLTSQLCSGNTDGDGDLLENPALIIQDLLLSYCGLSSANVDAVQFALAASKIPYKFRGYIDKREKAISKIIADICRDAGLILTVDTNNDITIARHKLYHWTTSRAALLSLNGHRVDHSQQITPRPEDWHYDGIRLKYGYHPATDTFRKTATAGSTDYDDDKILEIESRWIWRDVDAADILDQWYRALFTSYPTMLSCDIPMRLDVGLKSCVSWSGDGFSSRVFYVLRSARNWAGCSSQITAVDSQLDLHRGQWMDTGAPAFGAATDAQKQTNGFWYDTKYSSWSHD